MCVDPWARRRRWLFVLVVAACAVASAMGVAMASTDWTITFWPAEGSGCSSAPDVPMLTVPPDTKITLVNRTGLDAVLDIGDRNASPRLADGDGVWVTLGRGEHAVRMIPDCQDEAGTIEAAMVYVLKATAATTGTSTAIPTGTGVAPAPGLMTLTEPTASPSAESDGVSLPGAATPTTSPTMAIMSGNSGSEPVLGGGSEPEQIGEPFRVDGDNRGVRLVAVVALICILGVSVGIIRAIRAQRASSAARRGT
jgi:hypothetical protein